MKKLDLAIMEKLIDSDDFTVGGGAASALSGAMAAGMASMVSKLSYEKSFGLSTENYRTISLQADQLATKLLAGAEDDRKAYLLIKQAYALPKGSEAEKAARRLAIQQAGYEAANVPLQNGLHNQQVYQLICQLEGHSNPACLSDLLCAKYLSLVGIRGCILNIQANLPLIKDTQQIQSLTAAVETLKLSLHADS